MSIAHQSFVGCLLFQDASGNITQLYCSEMATSLNSAPTFYDHTMASEAYYTNNQSPAGSGNTFATGLYKAPIQKKIYRYSPITPRITASGFFATATDTGGNGTDHDHSLLVNAAQIVPHRGARHTVSAVFWPSSATAQPIQTLYQAVVNSLTIEIRGGEPVSFQAEIMGLYWDQNPLTTGYLTGSPVSTGSPPVYGSIATDVAKLLTWDRCAVYTNLGDVQSFNITIKNNISTVFTAGSIAGTPPPNGVASVRGIRELRTGMQEVTGSVTVFNFPDFTAWGDSMPPADFIEFHLDTAQYRLGAAFTTPENRGAAGSPFNSTVNFAGTQVVSGEAVWLTPSVASNP